MIVLILIIKYITWNCVQEISTVCIHFMEVITEIAGMETSSSENGDFYFEEIWFVFFKFAHATATACESFDGNFKDS